MKKIIVFISFFFQAISADDRACINSDSLPCLAMDNMDKLPKNDKCDPVDEKNCEISDLIDEEISTCRLEMVDPEDAGDLQYSKRLNPDARCYPVIRRYINVYRNRIVGESAGNPTCVPAPKNVKSPKKQFLCGSQGSRCACDTGIPDPMDPEYFLKHKCRCQWFVDYCSIPNVCVGPGAQCTTINQGSQRVTCQGGTINHCVVNPKLCKSKEYCVELEDKDMTWERDEEKEGEGFACIAKDVAAMLPEAPFCNFRGIRANMRTAPFDGVDKCCYHHLNCGLQDRTVDQVASGSSDYLFGNRPCYCNVEFRNCLMKVAEERKGKKEDKMKAMATALVSIVDKISICSMDDSGRCDPRKPDTCNKGDLISQDMAHCKVNCKTGPLLPIEHRACRIRQCHPKNNVKEGGGRIVDVTYHHESSRCDAVKGLPVRCGMKQTRCVCDGKPTTKYFTDRCRCQFWPME